MVVRSRRALAAALAAATLSACATSRPAPPPFRVTIDAGASTGMVRRVVSVGAFGAVVEGQIGAVVLAPTGADLPRSYTLTLVVGDTAAVGGAAGRLEGLTVEADTWRLETGSGLAERVSEGGWGTSATAGTHVRIEGAGPGRVRLVFPLATLRRLARADRARVAWVDAYRN